MKRILIAGIGLTAAIAAVPHLWSAATAENIQSQPQVHLNLDAQKQIVQKDKVSWQSLKDGAVVQKNDVILYTITGQNLSDRPVKNLTINEPIPQQMAYILKSADVDYSTGSKITFSIDGGHTFNEHPTVKVKLPNGNIETRPAPATAYTNIRLIVSVVAPKTSVKGTYQTQVK